MKVLLNLSVILLWVGSCIGYNILFLLPYPGKSHHMVFEPLIQELVERGHNLTVVSFFSSPSLHPNRRDVSLLGLAPVSFEIVDLKDFDSSYFGLRRYFEHVPFAIELAKMNLQLCKKLLDSDVMTEFVEAKGNYDVIVTEHFNSDCMLGLIHNYGLPSVGLSSCVLLPFTYARVGAPDNPAYVPGMTLSLTDKMTFMEKLENTFYFYFYDIWFKVFIRGQEQKVLEERLGKKLPPLEDVAKNASVLLVNTHHILNGNRVLPPSVVEVGGIHLHNRSVQPLPEDLEDWVSGAADGFILFSFGSLIRGSTLPQHRLRAILNVFARLPQRVLWKWETGDIDDLPPNVRVIRWLPQYDLLHHNNCVAFMTHGGLLSLTEAVEAGVPVLTVPILGDQFGNAAHAQAAGVAQVLRFQHIDEGTLHDALSKVLSQEMRAHAKKLSEMWRDRPLSPMETAVYHVERTARYGGPQLSSQARWLSLYEELLLDVIAFALIIISGMVVIVKGMIKKKKLKQC